MGDAYHGGATLVEKAKHFDTNKIALQWLLSMSGIDEVAKVGEYGAKKYGQNNWRGGSDWMRYAGSCCRHLSSFIRGESVDHESGLKHLAHLAYNALILLTWENEGAGNDDRPKMVTAGERFTLDSGVPVSCSCPATDLHRDIGSGACEIIE